MIPRRKLETLYLAQGLSRKEIASKLHCSQNQVAYWMKKYNIQTRTISQAIYQKNNPSGDPFRHQIPTTIESAMLYGLGMGLYWGEGTKANKSSVRIGNTDARLIKYFMRFLMDLYGVKKSDFRFSLQVFSDLDKNAVARYWVKTLGVKSTQFTKPTITPFRSIGTYRQKSTFGVITLYFHNTRLRDLINEQLSGIDEYLFKR